MKALKIEANKAGKRYALVPDADTFGVYAECTNYSAGRYLKTWRYCEKGLARDAADALFVRKLAGKSR